MAWREALLKNSISPGILGGLSTGDWLRLLRQNRFAVAPEYFPRAMMVTVQALPNSILRAWEAWRFQDKWEATAIAPPVFVLGHWRSGTTHLHNLLTVDKRFAFPNTFQCMYPHTFLTTEAISSPLLGFFVPKIRPLDNVVLGLDTTMEDEFALSLDCFKSPFMGWVFPNHQDVYAKYLTFEGASVHEVDAWKNSLIKFLRKLTFKYQKPLVLKSPPHTARVATLLKLFPDAKFVHIHRNPYAVYQSSIKTFTLNFKMFALHKPRLEELEERTLRQYSEMYASFFEQRKLIPAENYHEVAFEELERDPVGEVRKLYRALSLPDFSEAQADLEKYVLTLSGYKKNAFTELSSAIRQRIADRWKGSFEEWNYPV